MVNNEVKTKIKKEIARYFYHGYTLIQIKSDLEKVEQFVDRNFSRIVYGKKDGKIFGAAAFLTLTDSTLEKVKSGEVDLQKPEHMKQAEKERGDNIHFFAVRTEGADMIRLGIKSIIKRKNPKTISWASPRNDKCFVLHMKN